MKQRLAPTEKRPLSAIIATALTISLALVPAMSIAQDQGVATRPPAEHSGETPLGDYLAGVFAQQQRDYDNAADLIARALAADPDNPELIANAMVLMAMEGRFERAFAPLEPCAKRITKQVSATSIGSPREKS